MSPCYFHLILWLDMGRKANGKSGEERYDENIVEALRKLKVPIMGIDGRVFTFRKKFRNETGLQHIAKKAHRLKVRDIESIPDILKHPRHCCVDAHNKLYRNYYGIRKGNDSHSFLKVVTSPVKGRRDLEEIIITIFPVNSIKG